MYFYNEILTSDRDLDEKPLPPFEQALKESTKLFLWKIKNIQNEHIFP